MPRVREEKTRWRTRRGTDCRVWVWGGTTCEWGLSSNLDDDSYFYAVATCPIAISMLHATMLPWLYPMSEGNWDIPLEEQVWVCESVICDFLDISYRRDISDRVIDSWRLLWYEGWSVWWIVWVCQRVSAQVGPNLVRCQTGGPRDVSTANRGAYCRQTGTLLRSPRWYDHCHRGRGELHFLFMRWAKKKEK